MSTLSRRPPSPPDELADRDDRSATRSPPRGVTIPQSEALDEDVCIGASVPPASDFAISPAPSPSRDITILERR